MENEEWRMRNGEQGIGNRKCRMRNGEWEMWNRERGMGNTE